jgi:hypothetical protein
MVLAVVFFGLGFIIDIPALSVIGAVLLFGLGLFMLNDNIEVQNGVNITNVIDNGTIISSQEIKTYENYSFGGFGGTSFGFLFLILGILLFIITLTMLGGND